MMESASHATEFPVPKPSAQQSADDTKFQSYGSLLALAVLPNITVLPSLPPFPLISGIPVAWLCFGMFLGRKPGVPDWLMPGASLQQRSRQGRVGRFVAWFDRMMSRPGPPIAAALIGAPAMRLHSFCAMLANIALCAPIPPVNALGAVGLLVLSLGLARRDGRLAALGSVLCVVSLAGVVLAFTAVVRALDCGDVPLFDCIPSLSGG